MVEIRIGASQCLVLPFFASSHKGVHQETLNNLPGVGLIRMLLAGIEVVNPINYTVNMVYCLKNNISQRNTIFKCKIRNKTSYQFEI